MKMVCTKEIQIATRWTTERAPSGQCLDLVRTTFDELEHDHCQRNTENHDQKRLEGREVVSDVRRRRSPHGVSRLSHERHRSREERDRDRAKRDVAMFEQKRENEVYIDSPPF